MRIIDFEVGTMGNLMYFIVKNDCFIVIDPSFGYDEIIKMSKEKNLVGILITHGHYDHTISLREIKQDFKDVRIYMSGKDQFLLPFDVEFDDISLKDEIKLGDFVVKILHTPGHSPGSVCYLVEENLFTGDTLFYDSCGRVDLPGSNAEDMRQSLLKISALDENIVIHPGHNYDGKNIVLSHAKKINPFLANANNKDLFHSIIL